MIKLIPTSPDGAVSGGITEFQWSTSEQIWPFEKDDLGNALYCKKVDLGTLPNNGNKFVNHNIPSLDMTKVFDLRGRMLSNNSSTGDWRLLDHADAGSTYNVALLAGNTVIGLQTSYNWSAFYAIAYIVYAK